MHDYYVYIMTNASRTLYVGVTNDLMRRVQEHKNKIHQGFTQRYNISILVYYEHATEIESAIMREKQIKGWSRARKVTLVESANPEWRDLSGDWKDDLPDDVELPLTERRVQ